MTSSNISLMCSKNRSLVGIPTSSTVGIAVGIPVAGVLLASSIIAIVIVFVRRKYKQRVMKSANEQVNDHTEDVHEKPTTVVQSLTTTGNNHNSLYENFNRHYENTPASDNLYYSFNSEISRTGNDESTRTDLSHIYFVLENDQGTDNQRESIYRSEREAAGLGTRGNEMHCTNINIGKDNTYDCTIANGIEKAQILEKTVNDDVYDITGAIDFNTQRIAVSTDSPNTVAEETAIIQTCSENAHNYNTNYYSCSNSSQEIDMTENIYYNLE